MSKQNAPNAPAVDTIRRLTADELRKLYPQVPSYLHNGEDEEQCKRAELQRRTKLFQALESQLGQRYSHSRCSLESFVAENERQKQCIAQLRVFDVTKGRNLILYGTVGTGKDHLLAAMLYQVPRNGLTAGWINGPELFGRFRDGFDDDTKEEVILNRFIRPDVLGISDPVPIIGDSSPWRTETLYRVIEMRYRALKATWVTINAVSPDDADAKLTSPVFDRLRHGAEIIPCFWESYRECKPDG